MIVRARWDARYPLLVGYGDSRSGVEGPHVNDFPLSFVCLVEDIVQRVAIGAILSY
jgi:hypothetical protein